MVRLLGNILSLICFFFKFLSLIVLMFALWIVMMVAMVILMMMSGGFDNDRDKLLSLSPSCDLFLFYFKMLI